MSLRQKVVVSSKLICRGQQLTAVRTLRCTLPKSRLCGHHITRVPHMSEQNISERTSVSFPFPTDRSSSARSLGWFCVFSWMAGSHICRQRSRRRRWKRFIPSGVCGRVKTGLCRRGSVEEAGELVRFQCESCSRLKRGGRHRLQSPRGDKIQISPAFFSRLYAKGG